MEADELEVWEKEQDVVMSLVGRRLARAEARQRPSVRGLASEVKRKNGWQLPEYIGDPTLDGVQRLLSTAVWEVEGVPRDVTIPSSDPTFFKNLTISGGPAPVRAYMAEFMPDILAGIIQPGRVFDCVVGLDVCHMGIRRWIVAK